MKRYWPEALLTLFVGVVIGTWFIPDGKLLDAVQRGISIVSFPIVVYALFYCCSKFADRHKLTYYFFVLSLFAGMIMLNYAFKFIPL